MEESILSLFSFRVLLVGIMSCRCLSGLPREFVGPPLKINNNFYAVLPYQIFFFLSFCVLLPCMSSSLAQISFVCAKGGLYVHLETIEKLLWFIWQANFHS